MADEELGDTAVAPGSVGSRLRQAREAAGLSRSDIAARTKIAERHIAAIEEDRFGDLASSTYAVGFSRAYARSIGLDEHQIANAVREALSARQAENGRTVAPTFEPGDPARVPGSMIAWIAAAAALVVIIVVFTLWRSYYSPAASLPDLTSDAVPEASASAPAALASAAPTSVQEPVVFTATQDRVWVKFTDADGNQLMQKEMVLGESYTVPADAKDPRIRTVRPDMLRITIGGKPVAPLADRRMAVTDMPVSAAALLARAPQPAPSRPTPVAAIATPSPSPAAPSPQPSPRPTRSPSAPSPAPASASEAPPAEPPAAVSAQNPADDAQTSTVSQ